MVWVWQRKYGFFVCEILILQSCKIAFAAAEKWNKEAFQNSAFFVPSCRSCAAANFVTKTSFPQFANPPPFLRKSFLAIFHHFRILRQLLWPWTRLFLPPLAAAAAAFGPRGKVSQPARVAKSAKWSAHNNRRSYTFWQPFFEDGTRKLSSAAAAAVKPWHFMTAFPSQV